MLNEGGSSPVGHSSRSGAAALLERAVLDVHVGERGERGRPDGRIAGREQRQGGDRVRLAAGEVAAPLARGRAQAQRGGVAGPSSCARGPRRRRASTPRWRGAAGPRARSRPCRRSRRSPPRAPRARVLGADLVEQPPVAPRGLGERRDLGAGRAVVAPNTSAIIASRLRSAAVSPRLTSGSSASRRSNVSPLGSPPTRRRRGRLERQAQEQLTVELVRELRTSSSAAAMAAASRRPGSAPSTGRGRRSRARPGCSTAASPPPCGPAPRGARWRPRPRRGRAAPPAAARPAPPPPAPGAGIARPGRRRRGRRPVAPPRSARRTPIARRRDRALPADARRRARSGPGRARARARRRDGAGPAPPAGSSRRATAG